MPNTDAKSSINYVNKSSSTLGLDIKDSCRVATTTNITLSGTQTIDGVSIIVNNRVLVKDQLNSIQNGIYVCSSGPWLRSTDLNIGFRAANIFTFIEEGSSNADKGFVCTTNSDSDKVGLNNLAFSQFTGVTASVATAVTVSDESSDTSCHVLFTNEATGNLGPKTGTNLLFNSSSGALSVGGDITAYSSDKRLKTNIEIIKSPLEKINKLSGFTYDWDIDNCTKVGFEPTNEKQIGVFAQDVKEVIPEAVQIAPFDRDKNGTSKSGDNYLTVQYEKIIPILIESIKEQQKQIEELKNMMV
tara:strand:- start:47 stop:949 length:903 start_codon:yes stop_codon:yes gene_type:complete